MTLVSYKIIAALIIFLTSMAIAIYPLRKKVSLNHTESVGLSEAIASGIFLGAAFFHMLPDAIKIFAEVYGTQSYPIPEVICVIGFLLLLLLERLSFTLHSTSSIPYILAIILIVHALVEGAALGIGSTFSEAFMLFIAIVAHKGSESFALCITMLRHHLPFKRILSIVIFFSLMTPLGIGLGTAVNVLTLKGSGKLAEAAFNAFAAGTFLYISTLHHIHFHKHTTETQGILEFSCLVLGVVIMGLIALWT